MNSYDNENIDQDLLNQMMNDAKNSDFDEKDFDSNLNSIDYKEENEIEPNILDDNLEVIEYKPESNTLDLTNGNDLEIIEEEDPFVNLNLPDIIIDDSNINVNSEFINSTKIKNTIIQPTTVIEIIQLWTDCICFLISKIGENNSIKKPKLPYCYNINSNVDNFKKTAIDKIQKIELHIGLQNLKILMDSFQKYVSKMNEIIKILVNTDLQLLQKYMEIMNQLNNHFKYREEYIKNIKDKLHSKVPSIDNIPIKTSKINHLLKENDELLKNLSFDSKMEILKEKIKDSEDKIKDSEVKNEDFEEIKKLELEAEEKSKSNAINIAKIKKTHQIITEESENYLNLLNTRITKDK